MVKPPDVSHAQGGLRSAIVGPVPAVLGEQRQSCGVVEGVKPDAPPHLVCRCLKQGMVHGHRNCSLRLWLRALEW